MNAMFLCIPRYRRAGLALAAVLACAATARAAEPERKPPAVDQKQIDAAIGKGAEWLRGRLAFGLPDLDQGKSGLHSGQTYREIVLYALLHAGVKRGDPALIALVHEIRQKGPRHTYGGAMRAMAFATYNPKTFKQDLVLCTTFLVDNQGKSGQWGYSHRVSLPPIPRITLTPSKAPPNYTFTKGGGNAGAHVDDPAAPAEPAPAPAPVAAPPRKDTSGRTIPTGANWGRRMTQPKGKEKKLLVPRRSFGSAHDNSNSQYALLGLSACMGGGVFPAPDCLKRAEEWWTSCQNDDGGWDYAGQGKAKGSSYGSMTAGGVSSLAVCLQGDGKGRDPLEDDRIKKGLEWLGQNLSYGSNPMAPGNIAKNAWSHYYWVYAVERAGSLTGTDWFGNRPWYSEGASFLLSAQNPDGTWGNGTTDGQKIIDTCWSILFLRRATKQIRRKMVVFTHDSHKEK
jgi:hypothetical protein